MSDAKKIRVLVADDEIPGRQRIEDLLATHREVEVIASAASGDEAVAAIRAKKPDLAFLDVQMPGRSGIDVVTEIGADDMPVTIFVTAYDKFALKAFEIAAIDYLLKPFDDERFEQAFARAKRAIELAEPASSKLKIIAAEYLDTIAVESRNQTRAVPVARIDYITASGPYAELHVGDKTYAIRERMQSLEQRLDPVRFLRIHRSAIVRLDMVDAFLHRPGGNYAVRLKNGVELSVSRAKRDDVERQLGIQRR